MPGFIKCKVINHAQLRKANRFAVDNKFTRYLEDINDLKNIPEDIEVRVGNKKFGNRPLLIDQLKASKIKPIVALRDD